MVVTPYIECIRLIAIAGKHWQAIDGETALQGNNLYDLSLDRFMNALYAWSMAHVSHDELEDFTRQLEAPDPRTGRTVSDREIERDAEAFMSFAGAFGVSAPTAD